jgi:uncharacterized protein (DUF486 family)
MEMRQACGGFRDHFIVKARRSASLSSVLDEPFPTIHRGRTMSFTSPYVLPILLLLGSNIFMTLAWYGHLRFKEQPLMLVIVVAWAIAFIEYCMAVPANRWGSEVYSTAQLKTIQEVITLIVFAGFSVLYLKEPFTWNYAIGFAFIAVGAFFVFKGPLS